MTFDNLKTFLESKMKMSHIYQPLLIKLLVESDGSATIRQLALQFLGYDESQVRYYEKTLINMPIKVLSKHDVVERDKNLVSLNVVKLTFVQKAELKKICEQKIQEYIQKRGLSVWDYRLIDNDPMPDSLRYRVLKDGKGICALCGASKNERVLDVDHIIPRSLGGKTEYSNLQLLCSKCNRSKGNKDNTDFRDNPVDKVDSCPFCLPEDIIIENSLSLAIYDKYPVTIGHVLIIPKRHFTDYFEVTQKELIAINDLIRILKSMITEKDKKINGFNIGVNSGESAGQTISHLHFHLIPRRSGDVDNPKGGVRGVIPEKMNY